MPPPDLSPVASGAARLVVVAQRAEVMWRDGSSVGLHLVHELQPDGTTVPMPFLRALPDGPWFHIFDLRAVAPTLDAEIRSTRALDVQGLVFYTLRLSYPNATALRDCVVREALRSIPAAAAGAAPRPPLAKAA